MPDMLRATFWVVVPFGVTLLIVSAFVMGRGMPEMEGRETSQPGALQLVGRTISATALIEAQSRAPIAGQGITIPDTAVVILLGAIGCSRNQMQVLQYWSRQPDRPHPVLAVYADYLMSEVAASHESLVLRRVSQAKIPFLVSSDTTLSPRVMNIRTPQVVLVESSTITQVLALPPVGRL